MSFSITGMMSLDLGKSPRMVNLFRLWISELHSDNVIYPEHICENYEKQTIMMDISTWETMVVFRINDHHDVRMLGKHDLQGLSIT